MQLSSFLKDFQSSEITSDAKLDLSHVEIRPCKRSKICDDDDDDDDDDNNNNKLLLLHGLPTKGVWPYLQPDHCQRSSPSQISDTPRNLFIALQKPSAG